MKIKTSELKDLALDWAVAKAIGDYKPVAVPAYSTDWSQGGSIIEREEIAVRRSYNMEQEAWQAIRDGCKNNQSGPTPLIAAMRCYVASKLGDEVDVPEELI